VHKKTKVHLNILKAIEEDSLINFSPVYLKGFLKIYCRFLGVDPHDYIPEYKEPEYKAVLTDKLKEEPAAAKPVSFFQITANVIGRLKPYIKNLKRKNVIVTLAVMISVILFFKLGKTVSIKGGSSKKRSRAAVASRTSDRKTRDAGVSQGNLATVKSTPSTITIPQDKPVTSIKLGIRAKEDCWIQLKADGRMIFQNILKKGRYESWKADKKIEFSLGNAGVVDLEVNGKLVSNLGRRGQVIKNIVITREGLTIPR
jgi:cytoskeletal protein RodZ